MRTPTTLMRLATLAREAGAATAVIERDGDQWSSATWSELYERVERAAAGLISSGLRESQIVLVMLPGGEEALEVQYGVLAAGGVPIIVAPEVTAEELTEALAGIPVGLAVLSAAGATPALQGVDLEGVRTLELDAAGTEWRRLLALGALALGQDPAMVSGPDEASTRLAQRAIIVSPGLLEPSVWQVKGPSRGILARDRFLISGLPSDPHVQGAVETHLTSGTTLLWARNVEEVAAALTGVRLTHVHLDARAATGFDAMVAGAVVEGQEWTTNPEHVMDTVRDHEPGTPMTPLVRRRLDAAERLGEWFGPELRRFHVVGGANRLVQHLGALLGFEVDEVREPRVAGCEVPRPSIRKPRSSGLPRRERRDRDGAFGLPGGSPEATPAAEPDAPASLVRAPRVPASSSPASSSPASSSPASAPAAEQAQISNDDSPELPSLELLAGESVLDRLLAARAAEAAPDVAEPESEEPQSRRSATYRALPSRAQRLNKSASTPTK